MKLKSSFRRGSPSFVWFLFPPRAWLLPRMQISSTNLWRAADLRALSIAETPGWWRKRGHRGVMSTPGGRQVFSDPVLAEGSNTDRLFRSHTISKCEVPFRGRRVLLEQTCSIWSYSFIFLFNSPFHAVTYSTFCDAAFDLSNTCFCFCNTCFFVTFRISCGVAGSNIILLRFQSPSATRTKNSIESYLFRLVMSLGSRLHKNLSAATQPKLKS